MFDFGLRLKELRERKKLSQSVLARRINKSKSVISGYENNIKTPPVDVLIKLALIYNVSIDYLVGIEKKETVSLEGLKSTQKDLIQKLILEFQNSKNYSCQGLSKFQQEILNSLIVEFSLK